MLKSSDASGEPAGLCRRHEPTLRSIGTFAIDRRSARDNTDTVNTGSLGWSFTLADNDPVLQSLAAGQTITQVYTVTDQGQQQRAP